VIGIVVVVTLLVVTAVAVAVRRGLFKVKPTSYSVMASAPDDFEDSDFEDV
jgi:hypothetical protein